MIVAVAAILDLRVGGLYVTLCGLLILVLVYDLVICRFVTGCLCLLLIGLNFG